MGYLNPVFNNAALQNPRLPYVIRNTRKTTPSGTREADLRKTSESHLDKPRLLGSSDRAVNFIPLGSFPMVDYKFIRFSGIDE